MLRNSYLTDREWGCKMFEQTIESVVNDLIQLDIDASVAYEQAIAEIEEKDIKQQLTRFREDHERHISELSSLLESLGGKPIEKSQDIKGYIIEGMTKIQSMMGTKNALRAMITNEKITNKKYAAALEFSGFTREVRQLIRDNYQDEQRHLKYVEEKLEELKQQE